MSGNDDMNDDNEDVSVSEMSGVDIGDDETENDTIFNQQSESESSASDDSSVDFDLESLQKAAEGITQGRIEQGPTTERLKELIEDGTITSTTVQDVEQGNVTPDSLRDFIPLGNHVAQEVSQQFDYASFFNPETAPVKKDYYGWEQFKVEHYYTDFDYETFTGEYPTAGEGRFEDESATETGIIPFDETEYLEGDDPYDIQAQIFEVGGECDALAEQVDKRTVHVPDDYDEDEFFTTFSGNTTVVNRYDLEKGVPFAKKSHFKEVERYWVNEPFAFIVIYRSVKENETKYYVVEPYLTPIEENVVEFLVDKLRNVIKYAGDGAMIDSEIDRANVIERETYKLLDRYGIYRRSGEAKKPETLVEQMKRRVEDLREQNSIQDYVDKFNALFDEERSKPAPPSQAGTDPQRENIYTAPSELPQLEGISTRPESALLEDDDEQLNEYQVEKILYYLKRDFIGYEAIDPIKSDINVEDISCDGYNEPVFAYHTDYEQLITNVYQGKDSLDEFVVKLAQRSGKGISKRQPQVDCTLPDGSRAQLTLGDEVSDKGTNYTIRQFKDVPFTPVDLINWRTFSLEQMAYLFLCIENHKSLIFAGGTASGKTTSLNAISLFIPSKAKIVSIEDTREVELPQRNWIASVTRPSFSDDEKGDIDEFDLLEAALRQRPDYIVMGEIRGEEGRTLFQVMSTGHTTYTTFHADSIEEVIKRFTTEPINVSKTMFTALDLVSIQTQTRVEGNKVRRSKSITEVIDYNADNDEIQVQDVFQWQAETDQMMRLAGSETLEDIKFDRGWGQQKLDEEIFKRKAVLAYLIKNRLSEYTQVAATIQAFINDPETVISLMAEDKLEKRLNDLREMESVMIDIDQEKEDMVPRPTPDEEMELQVDEILDEARETIFSDAEPAKSVNLKDALAEEKAEQAEDTVVDPDSDEEIYEQLMSADNDGTSVAGELPSGNESTMDDSGDTDDDLFVGGGNMFDFGSSDATEDEEEDDDQPEWLTGS